MGVAEGIIVDTCLVSLLQDFSHVSETLQDKFCVLKST